MASLGSSLPASMPTGVWTAVSIRAPLAPVFLPWRCSRMASSSFVTTSAGDESILYAMALQPDNRILVGGNFGSGSAMLLRVNADGGLDSTFSWRLGNFASGGSRVFSLALQPDGKPLGGGNLPIGTSTNGIVSSFCRLKAYGSVDR